MTEDQSAGDEPSPAESDRAGESDNGSREPAGEPEGMSPEEREHFGLVDRVLGVWDDVIADMEGTAEAYRDDGWRVLEIHPGDVSAPDGDQGGRWGLDVLVPDDEFEELEHLIEVEAFSFDESEVYRAGGPGLVLLVVAVLDNDTEVAVLFPVYYDVNRGRSMLDRAAEAGELHTHLRPLDLENVVTFTHEDPSLFMPPESGEDTTDG